MEVKSFHIFIQDQHFSQNHCNQRNLDSHLHQVLFGGMAMLWELPALPCGYMESPCMRFTDWMHRIICAITWCGLALRSADLAGIVSWVWLLWPKLMQICLILLLTISHFTKVILADRSNIRRAGALMSQTQSLCWQRRQGSGALHSQLKTIHCEVAVSSRPPGILQPQPGWPQCSAKHKLAWHMVSVTAVCIRGALYILRLRGLWVHG